MQVVNRVAACEQGVQGVNVGVNSVCARCEQGVQSVLGVNRVCRV